jgi:hypothetical protein
MPNSLVSRRLIFCLFVLACAAGALGFSVHGAAQAEAERPWERIDDDDAIVIYKRDIPGQDLPGFRGETVMHAPLADIIATLKDHAHHKDWMHRCVIGEQLRDLGAGHSIDYNRTDAPWPVWDRDVVLMAQWTSSADGRLVTLSFQNTDPKLKPLPEKTVRMPKLVGFYKLWQLAPDRTKVVYQVEADPGGSLPTWLAKSVVRDLPYNTLASLRKRVTQ